MAEELPGFIPEVLRLDDVSLLRADETVLNAMVDGNSAEGRRELIRDRRGCRRPSGWGCRGKGCEVQSSDGVQCFWRGSGRTVPEELNLKIGDGHGEATEISKASDERRTNSGIPSMQRMGGAVDQSACH